MILTTLAILAMSTFSTPIFGYADLSYGMRRVPENSLAILGCFVFTRTNSSTDSYRVVNPSSLRCKYFSLPKSWRSKPISERASATRRVAFASSCTATRRKPACSAKKLYFAMTATMSARGVRTNCSVS